MKRHQQQQSPMLVHDKRSFNNMIICDDSTNKYVDELLDSDILNNASNSSYGGGGNALKANKLVNLPKKNEKFLDDEFMAALDADKPLNDDSVYLVNQPKDLQ